MDPGRRARTAAVLGLLSMFFATAGCWSCGGGYVLAVPLAIVGWMGGRAVLRVEEDESRRGSEAEAWARIGIWSSWLGGGLSALFLTTVLLWILAWSLGITTLASL